MKGQITRRRKGAKTTVSAEERALILCDTAPARRAWFDSDRPAVTLAPPDLVAVDVACLDGGAKAFLVHGKLSMAQSIVLHSLAPSLFRACADLEKAWGLWGVFAAPAWARRAKGAPRPTGLSRFYI